jgi:UDP-GlcNAc:undecaprenyl-phosphate GlcNAc-1-phosphate transferase
MTYFLVFATSALVSLVAAAAVIRAAVRYGAVVFPRANRWHRHPTPTFGGVAVILGLIASVVTQLPVLLAAWPLAGSVLGVMLALFAIGWYDDLRPFSALAKIVNSLAAAAFFVFVIRTTVADPASMTALVSLAAVLWFGFVDNAVNLLDNMDGLAAGVVAIAALGLASAFSAELGPALVFVLVAAAGALAGFIVWNRQPARLFMGNCGSLAMGGVLAACSVVAIARAGTIEAAFTAALILVVPIFDSAFVILLRRMAGRSTTAGNIDHTSHRLVSAGVPENRAVLILYALGISGAVAGFLLHRYGADTWPAGVVVALGALMLALHLARVPAYSGQDFAAFNDTPLKPLLSELTFRWHVAEVLLDLLLIALCYYLAYSLRFEDEALTTFRWSFTASLPLMLGCQIVALYSSGLYWRAWSMFGFHDLWPVVRGVGFGSMAAVLLIFSIYKNRPEAQLFSRGVFIIDALLLTAAIVGTRLSFRILTKAAAQAGHEKRRVVIYGAGGGGQLLVREMLANPTWLRDPVCFIDDDPAKQARRLMGVPVRGSVDTFEQVLATCSIDEVLLSSPSINGTREEKLRELCGMHGIAVRRLHVEIH